MPEWTCQERVRHQLSPACMPSLLALPALPWTALGALNLPETLSSGPLWTSRH